MNYIQSVSGAVDSVMQMYRAALNDLDEHAGGIGFWTPQIGWKRSALIGEYLLSSCMGAAESLRDASLAIDLYGQQVHADNDWLRKRWKAAAEAGGTPSDLLRASTVRNEIEMRREHLISLYSERALSSLATALDRLAAVVVIVAGVKTKLLTVDWGSLTGLNTSLQGNNPSQSLTSKFEHPGSPGRIRQNSLFATTQAWQQHGPKDWLPWLLKTRNTNAHKAGRMGFKVLIGKRYNPEGLLELFWQQPEWADLEAMLRSPQIGKGELRGLAGVLLPQRPLDTLLGLLESTCALTIAIAKEAVLLWEDRRADPALIVQHGGMWPDVNESTPLAFPGYGPHVDLVPGTELHIAPESGRRWRAAKILSEQRDEWQA